MTAEEILEEVRGILGEYHRFGLGSCMDALDTLEEIDNLVNTGETEELEP